MSDLDINDGVLAQLRSAADIVEVIGDHTRLKKAGRSWKGLCPFHNERTPSFTVDRDKGLYHCFGCGAGGDVIHFVRQADRLDFPEAVEVLAERFGVTIPRRAVRGPRDERREKLLDAIRGAHQFYARELARGGNKAAAYLEARGVPRELWTRLGMGYAPDAWESLARALGPAFPESLLVDAGLLQPRPEGRGAYDRFRDRLLFVVRDERGRPVGFGGRALARDAEPKYLNSPESPIFAKKRLLYGLSEAREAIRRRERVIVVEGYFDHLALVMAGLDEVVATMGTALTPEQAERLRRLASEVVFCYDGDAAGRAAVRGALPHLLAQGVSVSVAAMPPDEDPWDVLSRGGGSALASRIDEAARYLPWLFGELRPADSSLSSVEKKERTRQILDILKAIPDQILRYEETRKVSQEVSIPIEVLWEKPQGKPPGPPPAQGTGGNGGLLSSGEIPVLERRILQILAAGGYNSLILSTLRDDFLTHPGVKRVVTAIREADPTAESIDFQRQIDHLKEESDKSLLTRLALEEGTEPTEQEVARLLQRLEGLFLDRKSAALQAEIDRAQAAERPQPEMDDLLTRKQELKRRSAEITKSRKGKDLGN
ncbi:MAG: DNA primase [Thermoanaerobaculia bacterium]